MIRDRVRDEATAVAKAWSHPEVDPRHVLWGLIRVLGPAAPAEVPLATARSLLEPHGSAYLTPTVSAAAETELAKITDEASAVAAVLDLAKRLGPGGVDSPSSKTPGSGAPGAEATPPSTDQPSGSGTPKSRATVTSATATDAADHAPASTGASETTEAILAELDGLIGLAPVKAAVRRLIAVQLLNAERRAENLPEVDASLHVVFTGNPGTGKTTIARIIARLYGSIGLVSRGHLVECSRADLVAGYVGQTALKVQAVVDRAIGGVLFIDEAYSLAEEGAGEFGAEAVAMLVKLMEDHRDDLAVIVAGYPEPMQEFIDSNPGLRSRFTHYIDFPDFSPAELVEVFDRFADGARVRLGAGMEARLLPLFLAAHDLDNFGNARYARSIFERAYANMATRVLADGHIEPGEVDEMLVEDLPPDDPFVAARHPIGFRPR